QRQIQLQQFADDSKKTILTRIQFPDRLHMEQEPVKCRCFGFCKPEQLQRPPATVRADRLQPAASVHCKLQLGSSVPSSSWCSRQITRWMVRLRLNTGAGRESLDDPGCQHWHCLWYFRYVSNWRRQQSATLSGYNEWTNCDIRQR